MKTYISLKNERCVQVSSTIFEFSRNIKLFWWYSFFWLLNLLVDSVSSFLLFYLLLEIIKLCNFVVILSINLLTCQSVSPIYTFLKFYFSSFSEYGSKTQLSLTMSSTTYSINLSYKSGFINFMTCKGVFFFVIC